MPYHQLQPLLCCSWKHNCITLFCCKVCRFCPHKSHGYPIHLIHARAYSCADKLSPRLQNYYQWWHGKWSNNWINHTFGLHVHRDYSWKNIHSFCFHKHMPTNIIFMFLCHDIVQKICHLNTIPSNCKPHSRLQKNTNVINCLIQSY